VTAWPASAGTSSRSWRRAPGPGAARRLAESLREAAAQVIPAEGADPVSLTVSWAVYPDDGSDRAALMRAVDADLHAGKAARR
jgi:GGDEF domain-containing protein